MLGSSLFHRRRKLFNMGGGANPERSASILGGGVLPKVHICMCAHAHICTVTHVLNINSPMYACIRLHAQPMQTYILHPDTKIIRIKASDLYEKTATNIYK